MRYDRIKDKDTVGFTASVRVGDRVGDREVLGYGSGYGCGNG